MSWFHGSQEPNRFAAPPNGDQESSGAQAAAELVVKESVLDIDMYIGQSHSPDLARKLRVEFAGAHHESW